MNKKRIICFGDSNTWGYNAETGGRFEDDQRWASIMARALGHGYQVVEEGISGRTTVFDDPLNEGLRGMDYLYPCLMSHSPLDLLVVMLGTNDCKERFSASPQNIADGLDRIIRRAKAAPVWRSAPNVLVIAPILIGEACYHSPVSGEMGAGSVEKSRELPRLMKQCAAQNGCGYLDCNEMCVPNAIDFMHLDLESHGRLGNAAATKALSMLK